MKVVGMDEAVASSRVSLILSDQSVAVVYGPKIYGDKLVGFVDGKYHEYPTAQVKEVQVRQSAGGRTAALIAVSVVAVGGVVAWGLSSLGTKGARSGELRESPVVYSRDGDRYVVIASKGGAPTNPNWYHNLVAHPEVTVEAKGEKFKARAQIADGDEYERLYQNHAKTMPTFNEYRQKTTRKIPVVILERLDSK